MTSVSNLFEKNAWCAKSIEEACVSKIHGGLLRVLMRTQSGAACHDGKKELS